LAEIYQDQVTCNQHLSSANWFRYGDTCSKTFFNCHRIGKKKTILRELETENGPVTGQSNLSQYVTDFYARLYSSEAHVPDTQEAQERCWDNVLVRVASEINACLTKSLTLEEIIKAIHALPKGKAPGHDDIPMEFF
jgi:hypothetical protein